MITTTKVLDREERATYTLVIKAEDSAAVPNTAYATVSIVLIILSILQGDYIYTSV